MGLRRILYVEDEADIREIASIALRDLGGFEVALCAQGADTFAQARRFEPQLILLDVMMPRDDGITIFQALQRQPDLQRIPVIFLTAKAQHREIAALIELGALAVIAKPFDPMTLADQIRRLWADHGLK